MNAMPAFSVFSMINSETTLAEAFEALAAIEQALPTKKTDPETGTETDIGIEDQNDDLNVLRVKLETLQQDLALLNSLLQKVFDANGTNNLQSLKDMATTAAKDYRSTYDLTTFYTKEWFSRLFFNLDDKIDFANHLLGLAASQNVVSNLDCWQMMVANDPEMLAYISVPHMD